MDSAGGSQAQTKTERGFNVLTYIQIILLMVLIMPAGLISCALTGPVSGDASKNIAASSDNIFRSKDFIVYELPAGTTPDELAARFLRDSTKSWLIEEANPGAGFKRGELIAIPLNHFDRGGLHRDGIQTIPILTYHRFANECSSPLCVRSSIFDDQMRYLKDNDFHVISPEQLLAFLDYKEGLPRKSVLITMDDGYRSTYEIAYPILKKYGFTATLFIYTDFVGVSRMAITWDQLKELKANGFSIGSHTISHSDLTARADGETDAGWMARIERELIGSKVILDKKLNQDTFVLAYPYGKYDKRSISTARKAGYKLAMSVERGGNPFFADPMYLRRDQILRKEMQTFISRLNTFKPMSLK
jgi:peptidoglycan/xylan/chitin deacetylase (PgdA/CDA1 family)